MSKRRPSQPGPSGSADEHHRSRAAGGGDPPPEAQPGLELRVDIAGLRRRSSDHHRIEGDLAPAWVQSVLRDTDAEVGQAGALAAQLHIQPDGTVVVTGRVRTEFVVPCGRCLEPADVSDEARLEAVFVEGELPATGPASGQGEGEEGVGLSADDLDAWTYDGAQLDLAPLVAEQIKLAYPIRALCARGEDCRGLCSSCGAPLNEQAPAAVCERCQAPLEGIARGGAEPAEAATGPLAEALKKIRFD